MASVEYKDRGIDVILTKIGGVVPEFIDSISSTSRVPLGDTEQSISVLGDAKMRFGRKVGKPTP